MAKRKRAAAKGSVDWGRVTRGISGYDPYADAGDCWFDEKAAQLACDFFPECLQHVKGELAGKPFILGDWERAIIANTFGWKRKDGTRRYREVLIFVPRKNGKTTFAAGIVLLMLFCDGEGGSEIYSAAADRDQATLVFDQAKGMVLQDKDLSSRATVYAKAIALNDNSGSYKAISADANTKYGYNVHCAVIDELHAQPNRDLVDVLLTATGSRRQPLIVHITTADYARESICNEKLDYARKVRDGIIKDASFLPVIYEGQLSDDWKSPEVWKRVNPNLGVSVSMEYLQRECQHAQETPAYENTFKRLHLNITTEQEVRLIPMEQWDSPECSDEPGDLSGRECFAGLDLSNTKDITAFVLLFPDAGNAVLPFFWIPGNVAEQRERRDRVPYITWAREGWMDRTPGNVVDYDVVRARINELGKQYHIREIALDRWNSQQLETQLKGDGFEMVPFGQGYASMNAPTKELLTLLAKGALRHGGNPILRWMASNVGGEQDAAGNLKPSKKRSSEKIDGIVALIMALGRAMVKPAASKSVYAQRGLVRV